MKTKLFILLSSLLTITTLQAKDNAQTKAIEQRIVNGNIAAKTGNFDEAIAKLTTAIAQDNLNPRSYKLRGHVYYAMGDYPKALNDLNRVVTLLPDCANAYVDRAIVHSVMGHHSQAISDIERANSLKPDSVFVLSVRNEIMDRAK